MFSFGTTPTISLSFSESESRPTKRLIANDPNSAEYLVYGGLEPVVGTCEIALPSGKKLEHLGVKIELIGQIGKVHYIVICI